MIDIDVIDLTDGEFEYDYNKWSKNVPKDAIRFFEHENGFFSYFFKRRDDWKIVGDFFCYKENCDFIAKSFYKDGKLHGEVINISDGDVISIYIWKHGISEGESYEGVEQCKKYLAKKRLINL